MTDHGHFMDCTTPYGQQQGERENPIFVKTTLPHFELGHKNDEIEEYALGRGITTHKFQKFCCIIQLSAKESMSRLINFNVHLDGFFFTQV